MNTSKRRSLALFELVIVILFFAVSSVILVRVFAKAKLTSEDSFAKTAGVAVVQDIVERWKNDPSGSHENIFLSDGWRSDVADSSEYYAEFDKDMNASAENPAAYRVTAKLSGEEHGRGILYKIDVTLISARSGDVLMNVASEEYVPHRGGYHDER